MNYVSRIDEADDVDDQILRDLLELLWLEDFSGFRSRVLASLSNRSAVLPVAGLMVKVHLAPDPWRNDLRLVKVEEVISGKSISAERLLSLILEDNEHIGTSVRERTIGHLREAIRNKRDFVRFGDELASSARQDDAVGNSLLWERMAAWKDRPFHPMALCRGNLSSADMERYGAEAGLFFPLRWIAVSRLKSLSSPNAASQEPSAFILNNDQKTHLDDEMQNLSLTETHLAIPVHPWHAEHCIDDHFQDEIAKGEVRVLDFRGPLVSATSSLRTLAIPGKPGRHLKLPLGVETLGVRRLLSAQSLHNGLKGAGLVAEALGSSSSLGQLGKLADESRFWTFSEENGDVLAPRTAYLGCLIRDIPTEENAGVIPLAAFAVAPTSALPSVFTAILGQHPDGRDVEKLLDALFDLLIGFSIEALRCGFMPEMHGQNVLIEIEGGRPVRLILRDHDTVRCHPAALERAGFSVPNYRIKDPTRATLLLSRYQDLAAYAQTLLIDVALRAVCEALDRTGAVTLDTSRGLLRERLKQYIEGDDDDERRALFHHAFLEAPMWPFKQILTPLVATEELGLGMPGRMGEAINPLIDRGNVDG